MLCQFLVVMIDSNVVKKHEKMDFIEKYRGKPLKT